MTDAPDPIRTHFGSGPIPKVSPPVPPDFGTVIGFSVDPLQAGKRTNWKRNNLSKAVFDWWTRCPNHHDLIAVALVRDKDEPGRTMVSGYNAFTEQWDEWE